MAERRNQKDAMGGVEVGRSPSGVTPIAGGPHEGLLPPNGRWSTRCKLEVVLRMFSGEPISSLSPISGPKVLQRSAALFSTPT